MIKLSQHLKNQQGVTPLLILVAVVGVILFLAISFLAPFRNGLLTYLYPKPSSNAAQPDLDVLQPGPPGFVPDQVLVKFKDNVGQQIRAQVLAEHNLQQIDEISQIGIKVLHIPTGKTPQEVVEQLQSKNSSQIEFAEVNGIVYGLSIPNDPQYGSQWQLPIINAPAAWDSVNGSGIIIAIGDSGVEPTHPDLVANLVPGWNLVDNNSNTADVQGHGTAVAGSAAAVGNNSNQIASPAYNAKIMPIRMASVDPTTGKTTASFTNMGKAITYAADHGAKIINESYGASGWCADTSSTIQSAAKYMYGKGGITTFAAGNFNADTNCSNAANIVTSSSTDSNDVKASSSSFGINVDVAAPGANVFVTSKGGGVGGHSGTSFAAPITAGVLALIWQANPNLTPAQAVEVLIKSADDRGTAGYDIYYGNGRVNASKAVELAKTYVTPSPTPTSAPTATPTALPSTAPGETTPPTVSITSPANGSAVSRNSTFAISANAFDNVAVSKVEFYVDGGLKCTDTTSAYSCSTKIGGKPNASHTIQVRAYDPSNNSSSASITVTVQ